jgi:hypothetical protein
MTLGGFALAIGILVDNGTVVIENIERHVAMREPLHQAIVAAPAKWRFPTFLSTLCICIVFVPVFLLQGTAKYLFSPLSLSVIGALLASLALSFTMVPVLFNYLMRRAVHASSTPKHRIRAGRRGRDSRIPWCDSKRGSSAASKRFRESYRNTLCVGAFQARPPVIGVHRADRRLGAAVSVAGPGLLSAGRRRPDAAARARPGRHAPGENAAVFRRGRDADSQLVGNDQIDVMLDNIGLPYSGINIALSDSATVGPMDGEILIS